MKFTIRRLSLVFSALAIMMLVLSACGTGAETTDDGGDEAVDDGGEDVVEDEAVEETSDEFIVDLEGREVTIAIENAYLPFNYIDLETGEPGGWDYAAWDEICSRLNCTPVYVEQVWDTMIQSVSDGQYDAAADGITITEKRAEIVAFSDGYIAIEQRLLVRADEDRISSIEDIADSGGDLVLGTQTGTTNYETAAKHLDEADIQGFETFPFAIQALLTGDIDAVIIDETAGQGYLGENSEDLKLIGDSLSSDQLGFIFPLDSDLVDPVNQALDAMKADGTLEALSKEYFGDNFTITYDDIGDGAYAEDEEGEEDEGSEDTEGDLIADLEGREVTIAIENAYLPFNYIDLETGEPGGWDYAAWDEICTRLNCTPVYVEQGWDTMIQAVADGQYDAAADGITITEDRAEIVAFSDGYIAIEQRLLVRADEDRFSSIEEIAESGGEYVLGTQTGTTNYETATKFIDEADIRGFETFPFAIQALLTGDIDAVIIDETAGQGYLGEKADELKLIGDSLSSDMLGFIFPLDSDLVDLVNQALDAMKADGTLARLAEEFFGTNFTITYDDIEG